ncbi:hypothetical protein HK104_000076 [Borealophlyctis nickersoniae]|nr:hypothetical protein HK104_000076 [Borealophlyctis nickersoniae]
MAGFRQSTYIKLKCEDTSEWELHLRASSERKNLFGYLIRRDDLLQAIADSETQVLVSRKLPLVLDLDDTMVRVVGNTERYIPEDQLPLGKGTFQYCTADHLFSSLTDKKTKPTVDPTRIRYLRDGRRIVLAEHALEFLAWAEQFYDICICSIGDQDYVHQVVQVFNDAHHCIRGISYSARSEYDHHVRLGRRQPAAKDLRSLYPYYGVQIPNANRVPIEPLIIDDTPNVWPTEQHDNIIHVTPVQGAPVWNVKLLPAVKQCLEYVHHAFFHELAVWEGTSPADRGPPPSIIAIYKRFLRREVFRM